MYRDRDGAWVLETERHDLRDWPAGEPERDGALLRDCMEHGGSAWGAFDGGTLVGAAVLESRFLGRERDRLQLKFLHVSHRQRGAGIGDALFGEALARARRLGARKLYVSATPSENTMRFYRARGCRPTREPDPGLLALEPEDVHLECDVPD
ncbi:MAG: GNAT family N-acetyltransferase [Myxococcales bacterium]|nr:GNAT family N-acetyltransferase [Myxococcales bacterium]